MITYAKNVAWQDCKSVCGVWSVWGVLRKCGECWGSVGSVRGEWGVLGVLVKCQE